VQPSDLQATAKLTNWWKPKSTNILGILYVVMLITQLPFSKAIILFLPSVLTILGIGSFGHLINDWYDIEADLKVGKPNRLGRLSVGNRRLLVAASLAIALLPWLILPADPYSIGLLALEFLLFLVYAVPPVRLKERGAWPLAADGTYAYALPSLLAAHTFFLAANRVPGLFFYGTLFVWQLALGIRHFINHLALDRLNDIDSGTLTLATQKGNRFLHTLVRSYIFPLELIFFAGFLVYIASYNWQLPLAVLLSWCFFASLHLLLTIGRNYSFVTYRFSSTTIDWFYQNWWPLMPLLFLVLAQWQYGVLVVGHFLLFYPVRERFQFLKPFVPPQLFNLQSSWHQVVRFAVGFPLFFLVKFREENKKFDKLKKDVTEQPEDTGSPKKSTNSIRIAIANINQAKYSETFIHELIPSLSFQTYYLYGGELPLFDQEDRHFLSNWTSLQAWANFLEKFMDVKTDYFLSHSISSYIQSRKIQLILAQFGPVGVQLLPIARDTGTPLLVYFHGYDAFHLAQLRQHTVAYQALFREAKKIIVVSEQMRQQLHRLGAPYEKLIHLPAFVNLNLFPYTDHSSLPVRFLAVGRFAETKSPHLTLLAFHKVLQKKPDAVLVMVGKGGGGELYEACLILAKALKITERVIFKGVLTHQEVAIEMQQARVFVQHSLTTPEHGDQEGKPVAIIEAMACGLPVVATRHAGITELIEDGVHGFLVAEYDIDAMADAMLTLAQNDSLVRDMGEKASASIHHHPLISRHVEILEGIITDCIAQEAIN
jgi:colanic acid/amylovoran biosynthesis glycosyltransferase